MLVVACSSVIGTIVKPNDHFVPRAFFYPDHTECARVHVIQYDMVFSIVGTISLANSYGNPEDQGSFISIDRDTRTAWSCSWEDATSVVML
jgi:hypothetical protein